MLVFDIETTGLDARRHLVTVVCTEDYASGAKRCYEFARLRREAPEAVAPLVLEMVVALEEADTLCAFNGVRFDLPFLAAAFAIDNPTLTRWVLKTSDILEASRLVHSCTFSLNLLCQSNGLEAKIASGLQAVHMAAAGEWESLAEYCADDVAILCRLYRMRTVANPRSGRPMDLGRWAVGVY